MASLSVEWRNDKCCLLIDQWQAHYGPVIRYKHLCGDHISEDKRWSIHKKCVECGMIMPDELEALFMLQKFNARLSKRDVGPVFRAERITYG